MSRHEPLAEGMHLVCGKCSPYVEQLGDIPVMQYMGKKSFYSNVVIEEEKSMWGLNKSEWNHSECTSTCAKWLRPLD